MRGGGPQLWGDGRRFGLGGVKITVVFHLVKNKRHTFNHFDEIRYSVVTKRAGTRLQQHERSTAQTSHNLARKSRATLRATLEYRKSDKASGPWQPQESGTSSRNSTCKCSEVACRAARPFPARRYGDLLGRVWTLCMPLPHVLYLKGWFQQQNTKYLRISRLVFTRAF